MPHTEQALQQKLLEARLMVADKSLSKYTKQAYLNLVRDLEAKLGIESRPYNGGM